jgi:hypothetical protein
MTERNAMTGYSDDERLCLAAVWADDTVRSLTDQLGDQLLGPPAGVRITLELDTVETLLDGLQVMADTLHALTLPCPPPSVPPARDGHLRVVK